jgi:hypothetical protein
MMPYPVRRGNSSGESRFQLPFTPLASINISDDFRARSVDDPGGIGSTAERSFENSSVYGRSFSLSGP